MQSEFWVNEENVEALREFLRSIIGKGKAVRSAERFLKLARAADPALKDDALPVKETFRQFLGPKARRMKSDDHLTVLLRAGVTYIQRSHPKLTTSESFLKAQRLLVQHGGAPAVAAADGPQELSPTLIAQTRRIAMSYLALEKEHQNLLNERLFSSSDARADDTGRRARRYLCYRYHSHAGRVVKSLLEFREPPTTAHLFTEFECNFTHGRNRTRHSSGWVLAMGKAVYLLGEVDRGAGLKVIAVPHLEAGHDSYPGLILAMDEDFSAVTGRCVLVPLGPDDDPGQTGILDERASTDPWLKDLKAQIKNRINFTLDAELFYDGNPIDQDAMVHEVRRLLGGKFTYADGREFNPAATRHYTFNAALRKYDAANDN